MNSCADLFLYKGLVGSIIVYDISMAECIKNTNTVNKQKEEYLTKIYSRKRGAEAQQQ